MPRVEYGDSRRHPLALAGHGDFMTCTQGELIFFFIAFIALVAIFRYCIVFNSYCARVAKLEGRQKDFQSLQSLDGGGLNFFEIEQASKIWRRDYLKFNDEKINGLVAKLFRSGFVSLAAMISAALWLAYLKLGVCGIS
jgi:hypothetical protein